MTLAQLVTALPDLPPDEVATIFRAWRSREAGEPDDIVVWMQAREVLTSEALLAFARVVPVIVGVARGPQNLRPLGVIGRGGMGEVLLARDERLHRSVAVKRLTERAPAADTLRRFVAEAQLTAQLDHPGIVGVHALEPGPSPSYAMKLVRGVTLNVWLSEARRSPSERTSLAARLELFLQICEPIAYAHARGVLHRDLKPENVMVGAFGEVVVMDWGIARIVGQPLENLDLGEAPGGEGTQVGDIVGTPAYMSPEQARGEIDTMDARSDQYSLGLLLIEMATLQASRGRMKRGMAMLVAAARGEIGPVVSLRERLPRELRAVIRRATALHPDARYRDVSALAADVRRVLRGEAVQAAPDTMLQRAARGLLRHRERVATGIGALALVTLAGVGILAGAGFWLRDVERRAAAVEEARWRDAAALAQERARALDAMLLRQEGLLRGLAGAAQRALNAPAGGLPAAPNPSPTLYLASAFHDPATAPPDLAPSGIYRAPTSVDHPDLALAPGLDPLGAGVAPTLLALASLHPELQSTLLASVGEPVLANDIGDRIRTLGTPAVWAYVATSQGLLVGYPGVGTYPPDYDPRVQPWYAEGVARSGPGWGKAYVDESGMGLLISCTTPLRNGDGDAVGVVGLDLTVRALVGSWLAVGDGTGGAGDVEAFLVDDDGKVVIGSAAGKNLEAALGDVAFPYTEGWTAILEQPGRGERMVEGRLVVWSRLGAVPWTYVLVGG